MWIISKGLAQISDKQKVHDRQHAIDNKLIDLTETYVDSLSKLLIEARTEKQMKVIRRQLTHSRSFVYVLENNINSVQVDDELTQPN